MSKNDVAASDAGRSERGGMGGWARLCLVAGMLGLAAIAARKLGRVARPEPVGRSAMEALP